MGARVRIPLRVSLPCVAVSVAAPGAVAAGAVGGPMRRRVAEGISRMETPVAQ